MSDSDNSLGPMLNKDTPYSEWKGDAKAYLRRKGVYTHCIITPDPEADAETVASREKCAGILWGMLSKEVKPLVRAHEDDPKALWEALETILAPRKAGARFNAYRTLTSIRLREDETLLALTGRISTAMRLLKESRSKTFTLDNADEELQAVVLLMALPDEQFSVLKAPFEQSSADLKVAEIETAYANHQAFRTAHQEGDTNQHNPLSGLAMAVTSPVSNNLSPSNSALAAAPPAVPVTCPGCGRSGHTLFQCFQFLELIGKRPKKEKGAAPQVANTQAPLRT
ncbi:hypothetical protein FB45DRAFT_928338 [Roridomyces roridus]|uniref:Gag protein n=1 Tax=Roridomyces roridus TaxID=1738132 RepID=A0AAD7BHH8_9AGAR|nr:hypothetical protein FB45DRAFT_928338 [Roridomyces roridus]